MDSKVPASVHQPSKISHVMSPFSIYRLLTSVISKSPRSDGLRVITTGELRAVIDGAHKRGLKVTGHLCSITYREAAELGIDDIEHGFVLATDFNSEKRADACPLSTERSRAAFLALTPESPAVRELFQMLIQHHVAITSTLPVIEAYSSDRPPPQQRVLDVMSPQAQAGYLSQRVQQPINQGKWPTSRNLVTGITIFGVVPKPR